MKNWKSLSGSFSLLVILAALVVGFATDENEYTSGEKPDMSRFTPVVLGGPGILDEPMAFDVTNDGRVFIVERKGGVRMYNPQTDAIQDVGMLETNHVYTNYEGDVREAEEGVVGFILDPDFDENNWAYVLYADPHTAKHNLSRFTIVNDTMDMQSEQLLLDFHAQRNYCCHTGGGMDWDAEGNLYVTTGNNTGNARYSLTDERQGYEYQDDGRSAANTNDLRGKILRIHPEDDGTYSIPEGNLFEPGMPGTREEIYAMGLRNPWRISVDSETGWVYWGEVAAPFSYEEYNQARGPGFFGWPYFSGDNEAYPIHDYVNDVSGDPLDPEAPVNTSRNNTGRIHLPAAQPALIYYKYEASEEFPLVGSGSRSAVGGRVYHRADYPNSEDPFPAYYEDKYIITDLAREWIMAVTMDENGDYESMEQFLPDYHPVEPIDMDFGPDGHLYVLEYGSNWFRYSSNAQLVRIEYTSGNRAPKAVAAAAVRGGQVPFEVNLSSDGSVDYDGDALSYQWEITSAEGAPAETFTLSDPAVTLTEPGVYTATLTTTDTEGLTGQSSVELIAGNAAPEISLDIDRRNQSFFFPDETINYSISVSDAEDGSLSHGGIAQQDVSVSIDYVSGGFAYDAGSDNQSSSDAVGLHFVARTLMEGSDCAVCHQIESASAGPAFVNVASKYKDDADSTVAYLAAKIISGGGGVWGDMVMPAHPSLSPNDARLITEYVLSLDNHAGASLPAAGSHTLAIPAGDDGRGDFVLRAAYRDRGSNGLPPIASDTIAVLHNPQRSVADADVISQVAVENPRGLGWTIRPRAGSYIGYENVDFTGIRQFTLDAVVGSGRSGEVGGTIEVRFGGPDGDLIGQIEVVAPEGGGGFRRPPAPPVVIPLRSAVDGLRDVYFVFRNEEAGEIDPLMSLSYVWFAGAENPAGR